MKSKVSLVVAVVILLGAAVLGGWALLVHDDGPEGQAATPSSRPTAPAPATPPGSAPSAGSKGGTGGLKIPRGTVDPLKAGSYCATAKLLAIYSRQGFGLNKELGVIDGEKFAARLAVITAAYARLSEQAGHRPVTRSAVAPWHVLSEATAATADSLRVAGLQAVSQAMVQPYAELGKTIQVELPRATATLQKACGLSPSVFEP